MAYSPSFITLSDLFIAYRKAKKEAFEDTNCAHGLKFANFERKLEANLKALRRALLSGDSDWYDDIRFIGRATCIGKDVTPCEAADGSHFTISDPLEHWVRKHAKEQATAAFRPVIDATVEFQVISALWIIKVGHLFDATLDSRHAVGNRLRRWRAPADSEPGSVGPLNLRAQSLFAPYYRAYGGWRERGLAAMKTELKLGNRIVAVTMDLKKFYHQVDARFIVHPAYHKLTGVTLSRDERRFTEETIAAIHTWNKSAQERFGGNAIGLPVGLTAASLMANALLKEFDARVVEELAPVYYGRYVDDIFLVLRYGRKFESGSELMSWLAERLGSIAFYDGQDEKEPKLRLSFKYAEDSDLYFVEKKQRVFQLEGQHGLDLIDPIEEQIRRQRSEHRELPNVPDREAEMAARALLVTSDATLDADALRHADVVTLRRAGFAMLLGAIEQHALHVDGKDWNSLRQKFYGLAQRHLLTPHGFFAFHRYLPRVLGLMVASNDLEPASGFIERLNRLVRILKDTCVIEREEQLTACCRTLSERLAEAILQSRATNKGQQVQPLFRLLRKKLSRDADYPKSERAAKNRAGRLFLADWSRSRYALAWIESRIEGVTAARPPENRSVRSVLNLDAIEVFRKSAGLPQPYWPALAFPTRPISVAEITGYAPQLLSDYDSLRTVVIGLRGAWMPQASELRVRISRDGAPRVTIPTSNPAPVRVAVTNLETTDDEWRAAVLGSPITSLTRYRRMNRLINQIIEQSPRPTYVVLPECALPRRWARTVSTKLALNNVSLIAGLEYRRKAGGLRNEALVSVVSNFAGYPTNICVFQPKLAAAWGEKELIAQTIGLALHPPEADELSLPIYVHGDFCFGVLICSDLTTLANRNALQGEIDCLFVPEWNPDIDTFASLMEASAHDMHAFMVQANNRQFGDSRIRAPFKQNYLRDVVRVRGGLHDYFVIGEIDFRSLRKFQKNASPPLGPKEKFKPFPIGFRMSKFRASRA